MVCSVLTQHQYISFGYMFRFLQDHLQDNGNYMEVILVNNQLDAQFFFLIYLFQFFTCFEHSCAHHQGNQAH